MVIPSVYRYTRTRPRIGSNDFLPVKIPPTIAQTPVRKCMKDLKFNREQRSTDLIPLTLASN